MMNNKINAETEKKSNDLSKNVCLDEQKEDAVMLKWQHSVKMCNTAS